MTGREKILAAFHPEGTPEIGVAASYPRIFVRDHYAALTAVPWGDPDRAGALARDFASATGLEWFEVNECPSRDERAKWRYEQRADGAWRVNIQTGEEIKIAAPLPSAAGTPSAVSRHMDFDSLPAARADIDARIPLNHAFNEAQFLADGRHDAAFAVRKATGLFIYGHLVSPLWMLYSLLGYEGMMLLVAQAPELAAYAGGRILENDIQRIRMISALDADAVWIEECLTDQINPKLFRTINVPLLQKCVSEIRAAGMKSIYYYCGNPNDRFDAIMEVGSDAVHFEEDKKGFSVDIAEIAGKVKGRCVVFGNLDSVNVLEKGSDERLRSEIRRQLDAGRKNGNRFVLSTGSPITPGTPVERVRLYTNLAREPDVKACAR